MSCKCQGCGEKYKIDIMVIDGLWEKIKPMGKSVGGGLLCGKCILTRIEKIIGYSSFTLKEI